MAITITAFTDGGMISMDYTCDGKDISPPPSVFPANILPP